MTLPEERYRPFYNDRIVLCYADTTIDVSGGTISLHTDFPGDFKRVKDPALPGEWRQTERDNGAVLYYHEPYRKPLFIASAGDNIARFGRFDRAPRRGTLKHKPGPRP